MPGRDRRCLALGACALLLGCNDTGALAPASPSTPWQIETQQDGQSPDDRDGAPAPAADPSPGGPRHFALPRDPALPWPKDAVALDPSHGYGLAELIDVAQRRNQGTRVAWEQARQAAIEVGIARAAYLPELTAAALVGYQHTALPFPNRLVAKGYISSNAEEVFPQLTLRYLLLDFGATGAAVRAARQLSFAANVGFTGVHQKLILDVAHAYFALDGVTAQLRAARAARSNAELLQRSAEAMTAHGMGTIVNVALARRGTAQAAFEIARATAAQHDAMYSLLQAMGLPPSTGLRVADSSERPLPRQTSGTVDRMMRDALQRRPDLLADLARLRATDAGVALARADFYPKLSVSADIQGNIGQISTDGSPYQGIKQPQVGVFMGFHWPLYEGGLRENRLRLAQSQRDSAEDALRQGEDGALHEVATAYDQLETGLVQYDAAIALRRAAQAAFDSAQDAFRNGVGSFTDAMTAQTALADAGATVARSHAQSLIDAASLAFATGGLTSSEAPGLGVPP